MLLDDFETPLLAKAEDLPPLETVTCTCHRLEMNFPNREFEQVSINGVISRRSIWSPYNEFFNHIHLVDTFDGLILK